MSLTAAQRRKFNDLVALVSSKDQLRRLTARLRLNKFVMEHGKDACQAAFDAETARLKKARK